MIAAQCIATVAVAWTDKLTAIGTAVAAGGIIVAAIGAWFAFDQLKETRRDRHVQVLSEFGKRWDEEPLKDARDCALGYTSADVAVEVERWFTPPRETESDVPRLLRIPNFFEDLAIMVEMGRLELLYVSKTFGAGAQAEWNYWKPAVEKVRSLGRPTAYTEFENMAAQLRDLEAKS